MTLVFSSFSKLPTLFVNTHVLLLFLCHLQDVNVRFWIRDWLDWLDFRDAWSVEGFVVRCEEWISELIEVPLCVYLC